MIRTQVYLTKTQSQTIKILAQKENKPTAEVIRELLDAGLKKKKKADEESPLLLLADKAVHTGITDLSTTIDKYLYE